MAQPATEPTQRQIDLMNKVSRVTVALFAKGMHTEMLAFTGTEAILNVHSTTALTEDDYLYTLTISVTP